MNKKISELNEAIEIADNDLLAIVQQGETKKIKAKLLCDCAGSNISLLDVRPGLYAGNIILIDQSIPANLSEFKRSITSEDRKFPFKRDTLVSVQAQVDVYLSDPESYFELSLQVFDEDFVELYGVSGRSPNGNGIEQVYYNLEVSIDSFTLSKGLYYIKTWFDIKQNK